MAKYHTLLVKHGKAEPWTIEFGDYDKEVVQQEREDSYSNCKAKIITTSDRQEDINAYVSFLNKETSHA